MLQTVAEDLRKNEEAIWTWIDAENCFDSVYAERLGVDMSRLLILKYSTMEDQLQRIIDLTRGHMMRGIVVDSVGALVPKAEMEDSKGNEHDLSHVGMLDLQRKLGQFFRMSNGSVAESKCAIILIAHVYQDINTHGAPFVVKGGNSLKHWSHIRLMLSRLQDKATVREIRLPDGNMEKIMSGHDVKIKLDKTRQNDKEHQFVVIPFKYGVGFDCLESAIQVGIKLGVIVRSGPIYSYGEIKHKGYDNLMTWFKENPSEMDGLILGIQKADPAAIKVEEETENEEL
jgi:recombination protein RecA